ncbi:hypothetical protein [[Mycobacterium] burgundiense]|uniref:Uncharacterized protein n=1 Tax=[Mycobacterium] burgundiense TaxID=3064286 RepID=A0ABM9LYD0_9MYCO|nr:hypothetical protein [Mycolicibacterium sp. MU0053]CAJ1506866.1 hypothetical protein MU0053_003319 [Mycolicibacterium sp. MU0053]
MADLEVAEDRSCSPKAVAAESSFAPVFDVRAANRRAIASTAACTAETAAEGLMRRAHADPTNTANQVHRRRIMLRRQRLQATQRHNS